MLNDLCSFLINRQNEWCRVICVIQPVTQWVTLVDSFNTIDPQVVLTLRVLTHLFIWA